MVDNCSDPASHKMSAWQDREKGREKERNGERQTETKTQRY